MNTGASGGHGEDEMMGDDLPSFEFRFEAAKLSLDLEETTDTAIRILSALLMENDACVDGETSHSMNAVLSC